MTETRKGLSYYNSLPYTYEILRSREDGFVASYPDLPGCAVQGEQLPETLEHLEEGKELWLRAKLERGEPIPEPRPDEPSGRLMQRVPVRLHATLDELAVAYGKSLNGFLNDLLFNHVNALPPWHGLGEPSFAADRDASGYAYWVTPEAEGGFVAEHPDLPGCLAMGDTPRKAMEELDEARELWLEAREEDDFPVPTALSETHNGTIHLRMPPALHADLVREAQRNGVSLNQFLSVVLAESVGKIESRRMQQPHFFPAPAHSDTVEQAPDEVLFFQTGDPDSAEQALAALSSREREFALGLMKFANGEFTQAIEHFNSSYKQGLEFSEDATRIYQAMPEPPAIDNLFKLLLPFFHRPQENRTPMALSFLAWIEKMRGNYEKAADFRKKQREAA